MPVMIISRIVFIRGCYSVMFSLKVLLVLHGSQSSSVLRPLGAGCGMEAMKISCLSCVSGLREVSVSSLLFSLVRQSGQRRMVPEASNRRDPAT